MPTFYDIFSYKPIIGMIHLSGGERTPPEVRTRVKVNRALEELSIFEEEGIDAAIIENYHGDKQAVYETLQEATKQPRKIILGINILPNQFEIAFRQANEFKLPFIQLDYVAGIYSEQHNQERMSAYYTAYAILKEQLFTHGIVLGGVWPKYYTPAPNSDLEKDIRAGMTRAEAIVVTGEGTGIQTPLDKIQRFRQITRNHPLIIGAGLTPQNASEQLRIADGAIVGSALKINNRTRALLDRTKIRELMTMVHRARAV